MVQRTINDKQQHPKLNYRYGFHVLLLLNRPLYEYHDALN